MDPTEESQNLEITALQSIYPDEFIEVPPPKAWKGASRLHEFVIRVSHPEPDHASKISFNLHVKFPKTYPRLACPTFTIEKPIKGINDTQAAKLLQSINAEAQRLKGFEMVFSIITFCQDWIQQNVTPPVEVVGSLALQMNQRAMDEEKARRQRETEEAQEEEERANRAAQELGAQIEADMLAKELQYKARKRANSGATEVPASPASGYGDIDMLTESFNEMDLGNGVRFNTVKLFHPRTAHLGLVYMADPIVDDIKGPTVPLELYVVSFQSHYYTTTQGRKKLNQVETAIKNVISIRHPKLLSIYAVKLNLPHSSGPPQLMVLMEQAPALTMHDVLQDCESLREDRASDYIGQILAALNSIHLSGLVHRGITTRCIGLASSDNPNQPKSIKLCKATFHARLLDLHRSNSFGPHTPVPVEEPLGGGWVSRDVQNESSLLYTRQRDIHDVGIVLAQMLMGLDVVTRVQDPQTAIQASSISPLMARQLMIMLEPPKKSIVSCDSLLSDMNGVMQLQSPNLTARGSVQFSVNDPKTPLPFQFGSPERLDHRLHQSLQVSRWKEDREELELLGLGRSSRLKTRLTRGPMPLKKICLKTMQRDSKNFREVNALSGLSHRNIVRYYTTWVETFDGMTSVPDPDTASERHLPVRGGFHLNIEDFDDISMSTTQIGVGAGSVLRPLVITEHGVQQEERTQVQ